MIGEDVLRYVHARLPDFEALGDPVRLPEGNLNFVWRVPGRPHAVIVKSAPPYIAANPDVPLDPSRLVFEARCLQALAPGGALNAVSRPDVCAPRPIDANLDEHVLIMEDVGTSPTLGRWLRAHGGEHGEAQHAEVVGRKLGAFIGRLHATTCGSNVYAEQFDNQPVQKTRRAVQYQAVREMLHRGGVDDAERLGDRAEALGERLLTPGRCLVMGDLWPPSVLVGDGNLRVIDWELAHYGEPLQDVAHLAAHLWMHTHRAHTPPHADAARRMNRAFFAAYRAALGDAAEVLVPSASLADYATHYAAEILVRAVGPFQSGYLYDGLEPEHPVVQEAVHRAAAHLRDPGCVGTFAPLAA